MKRPQIWNSCALHVVILLLVYVAHSALCASDCRFPKYLQHAVEGWVATYPNGGSYMGYFKGDIIRANQCSSEHACVQYHRKCVDKMGRDKYLVEHQEKGRPRMFLCMQFIKRSDSIVQIKQSPNSLLHQSQSLCDDDKMVLDQFPIAAPNNFNKHTITCPFSGGYNMVIYRSDGAYVCPERLVPLRMESECESGEGLAFNFRHRDCVHPNLEMEVNQKLLCLAEWTDERGFTFVILGHPTEFRGWCLRLKRRPLENQVDAHLFMDFVCDPGDDNGRMTSTTNYLSLRLESVIVSSVCEDEFDGCQSESRFCDTDVRMNCPRSCQDCKSELDLCIFPEYIRGHWLQSSLGRNTYFNITFYGMQVEGIGRFECHSVRDNNEKVSTNKTVLVQLFENGCHPRYKCLEIEKTAPSVLRYRLGNSVTWPQFPDDDLKRTVCRSNSFQIERSAGSDRRIAAPNKYLVKKNSKSRVNCSIPGEFGITNGRVYYKLQYLDGTRCDGCLAYDAVEHDDRLVLVPINCTAAGHVTSQSAYRCIASFPLSEKYHAVQTKTFHKHHEYLCWIFSWDNEDGERHIFVFGASDCNMATLRSAKDDINKPHMLFKISTNVARTCPYIAEITDPSLYTFTIDPGTPATETEATIYANGKHRPATDVIRTLETSEQRSEGVGGCTELRCSCMFVFIMLFVYVTVSR